MSLWTMATLKKKLLPTAFSAFVATGIVCVPQGAVAQDIDGQRQSELTRLVRQDCGSCHGMTLKGGLGKSLLSEDLVDFTSNEISEIILDGVTGTPMPGWKGLLTVQEANWIADQLKAGSIKKGNVK